MVVLKTWVDKSDGRRFLCYAMAEIQSPSKSKSCSGTSLRQVAGTPMAFKERRSGYGIGLKSIPH